eukprot:scaffold7473_cov403-Prasinococcus_capsulatus_cf.AAC.4
MIVNELESRILENALRKSMSEAVKEVPEHRKLDFASVDCTIGSDTLEHMKEKIKYAVLIHEPFPHVHIQDFFPHRFYQCLVSKLPREESFYDQVLTVAVAVPSASLAGPGGDSPRSLSRRCCCFWLS